MKKEYQSPAVQLQRLLTEDIMVASANEGKPFAEIGFDSLFEKEEELS